MIYMALLGVCQKPYKKLYFFYQIFGYSVVQRSKDNKQNNTIKNKFEVRLHGTSMGKRRLNSLTNLTLVTKYLGTP